MLDSAHLADAELRVRAWLTSPRPDIAVDPGRPLTKEEQKARIRAGMERDRAQRQAAAAQRRR